MGLIDRAGAESFGRSSNEKIILKLKFDAKYNSEVIENWWKTGIRTEGTESMSWQLADTEIEWSFLILLIFYFLIFFFCTDILSTLGLSSVTGREVL